MVQIDLRMKNKQLWESEADEKQINSIKKKDVWKWANKHQQEAAGRDGVGGEFVGGGVNICILIFNLDVYGVPPRSLAIVWLIN